MSTNIGSRSSSDASIPRVDRRDCDPRPRHGTKASSGHKVGRLHVITDEVIQSAHSHIDIARQALKGGAQVVQYREKRPISVGQQSRVAAAVVGLCREYGATCIVNDRPEVAHAADAQGVHLGTQDVAPERARAMLGPRALIGATANNLEQARQALAAPIDYLGVGPVFGTLSKENPASTLGLGALDAIARMSPVPVIAIGGIKPEQVSDVLGAGAFGIAVLSGISGQSDPEAAARRYTHAILGWLEARP